MRVNSFLKGEVGKWQIKYALVMHIKGIEKNIRFFSIFSVGKLWRNIKEEFVELEVWSLVLCFNYKPFLRSFFSLLWTNFTIFSFFHYSFLDFLFSYQIYIVLSLTSLHYIHTTQKHPNFPWIPMQTTIYHYNDQCFTYHRWM